MLRLLSLVLLLLASPALASDVWLGTITGSATTNNTTTAVAFTMNPGAVYSVQCDVAVWLRTGSSSALTVSSTTGIKLAADILFDLPLAANHAYLAIAPVAAGTFTCRVFWVSP
jgi:hypothetical protein